MIRYQPLSDFLTEYTLRNDNNQYKPVAVGRYGIRTRDSIYTKELAKDYSKNKVIYQDTLTVGMGSVQIDIGILTEDIRYSVSPAYHTYQIRNINPAYLRYCLECRNQDMFTRFVKRGSRQGKSIDLKRWLTYEIPVFDERKQAEIVAVLDRISTQVANRQEQLELFEQLVKSRFIELFGDPIDNPKAFPVRKLKTLSRKISDGVHAKPQYTETGRPFLSVVNINKGVINFDGCKFVSEEAYQKMIKSTHPERGDVLYTKVGATYGIPAYVDTDTEFCLYVSVCLIKPLHEEINSRFLSLSMGMPYVKRQADSRIKGIGVPDLHLNQISEFNILCPPRALQEQFIAFVEQTDKSKFFACQTLSFLLKLANNLQSWREKQYDY